ncbi:MAG TPA: FixH family protein [Steroidobacteraceae bacterium]|jgi:hypothetical protein|nr:FixH family protein [Steroidobacteraceae bacterium]
MRTTLAVLLGLYAALAAVMPAYAQATPVTARAMRVFTTDHHYRIDVVSVPNPIPLGKFFTLQLAVYDDRTPGRPLPDASVEVSAGMMHGSGHEFMHGMQSAPIVEKHPGRFVVQGMMFHMQGPWTVRVQVHEGTRSATADIPLQCCGG